MESKKEKWEEFYNENGRFYLLPHHAFPKLINLLHAYDCKSVIDLGCGNGRHLIALAEAGFQTTGIDISPAAVEMSRDWLAEKDLTAEVSLADLHEKIKTYQNSAFDAVIAVNSLNYESKEKFSAALREINRLLRKEGIFFLVLPSKETVITKPELEQVLFNEEELKLILMQSFKILEFFLDDEKNFVVIAQEK